MGREPGLRSPQLKTDPVTTCVSKSKLLDHFGPQCPHLCKDRQVNELRDAEGLMAWGLRHRPHPRLASCAGGRCALGRGKGQTWRPARVRPGGMGRGRRDSLWAWCSAAARPGAVCGSLPAERGRSWGRGKRASAWPSRGPGEARREGVMGTGTHAAPGRGRPGCQGHRVGAGESVARQSQARERVPGRAGPPCPLS